MTAFVPCYVELCNVRRYRKHLRSDTGHFFYSPLMLFTSVLTHCALLEHNLFKNMSKGPAFSRPNQIQTLKYGLDDAMQIKKKDLALIKYRITSNNSRVNYQLFTFFPAGIIRGRESLEV